MPNGRRGGRPDEPHRPVPDVPEKPKVSPDSMEITRTPGSDLPSIHDESTAEPKVGERVSKEGYVWWYRIKEFGYVTPDFSGDFSDMHMEQNTWFVVNISSNSDSEVFPKQFRVLWGNHRSGGEERAGEDLSVMMAAIATLKDVFFQGSKVKVNGRVMEYMAPHPMGGGSIPVQYYSLNEVIVIHP